MSIVGPGNESGDCKDLELRVVSGDSDNNASSASKTNGRDVLLLEAFSVMLLFLLATAISLVYVIFPCLNSDGTTNFWAYALAKQEWWALFTNAAYVEFAEVCLPGSSNRIYVYSYMLGALAIPIISVIGYGAGLRANYFMNVLIIGGPILPTFLTFGLLYPLGSHFNPNRARYRESMGDGRYDMLPSDMFTLITDPGRDTVDPLLRPSALREQWIELSRRLTVQQTRDDAEDSVVDADCAGGVTNPLSANNCVAAHDSTPSKTPDVTGWSVVDVIPDFVERHCLLPRFWSTPKPWAHITASNTRLHIAFTFIFLACWIASYFSFMTFAQLFRAASTNTSDRYTWFAAFCVSSFFLKIVMRKLGLLIDQGKVGTTSMFFIAEFMMSLFYFGYYRMLFEEFVSWPVFCFVQVVHFAMEWLVYCFRSSATFYEFICVADMSLPEAWRRHSNLTVFITKGLSHRDWQMFLSVELQLRLISLGISAPAFAVLLFATVRCWWVRSALKPVSYDQYAGVLGQVALCLVLEMVNCAVMYHSYYKGQKLPMFQYIAHCFRDPQFRVCCFLIAAVQFTNPFVVYEDYIGKFSYQ